MSKRTSIVARRAWEVLRALMCARKRELCRNRAALTFNSLHKLVRNLIHHHSAGKWRRGALLFGDHEFSFQSTPEVHVRMHRPPQVDGGAWGEDEEDDVMWRANLKAEEEEMSEDSEEGIDERAEEFIAKFYEEMKMQRQIS